MSDLGRVSYHAYWKSVVLEFLAERRHRPFTLEEVARTTGMHMNDIAQAFQLLGFVRYIPGDTGARLGLAVDWARVDEHARRLRAKPRLEIDPECLRWTPLLAPTVNPFRSPDEPSPTPAAATADDSDPRTETEDTATEPEDVPPPSAAGATDTTAPVAAAAVEPVEVTSSGRRRTRPLKYSETTYQTTPTAGEAPRKRKREVARSLVDAATPTDEGEREDVGRRSRARSLARRSTRDAASDSQESQDAPDLPATANTPTNKAVKTKRKIAWRGRPKKRSKVLRASVRAASPAVKRAKLDEKEGVEVRVDRTDEVTVTESGEPATVAATSPALTPAPTATVAQTNKRDSEASSEDSSGEADDEMDVEEGEPARVATPPPPLDDNSTDRHTSDMELDSIHMDSPKSLHDADHGADDRPPASSFSAERNDVQRSEGALASLEAENETKNLENREVEIKNGEITSPAKSGLEDKDTIVISESDDNNSQSCPLPSPEPTTVPVPRAPPADRPGHVDEKESPSKVITSFFTC